MAILCLVGCTYLTKEDYDARFDPDGDGSILGEDCDDRDAAIHPGAAEVPYDGLDNDCEAATPDDDLDGDGALLATDCDDEDAAIHPDAEEIWYDGVDQDCDGSSDDDQDGDGYDDLGHGGEDCDDLDASVHPGAVELGCDLVDQDCDGRDADLNVSDGTSEWSAEYSSVQDAIDAAASGDLICVAPGTYIELIDFLGKDVRVMGAAGAEETTLSGGDVSGPVVTFANGETSAALLQGFTITGGVADYGGGIYIRGASPTVLTSPTLMHLIISDNLAGDGGGISIGTSSATLQDVQLSGNVATHAGGGFGVLDTAGVPTLDGLEVIGNFAPYGGGGYGYVANAVFTAATFEANGSDDNGGALFLTCDGATPSYTQFSQTVFRDNTADQDHSGAGSGGAIWAQVACVVTLSQVEMTGNSAASGGGVGGQNGAKFSFTNAVLADNYAAYGGGGILIATGTSVTLVNTVVAFNDAENGAAVSLAGASLDAVNTSFYANASSGSGDEIATILVDGTSLFTATYSQASGNTPADPTLDVSTSPSSCAEPIFEDAAALDFRPAADSCLIDAGDPTLRDADGTASDIGAYSGGVDW